MSEPMLERLYDSRRHRHAGQGPDGGPRPPPGLPAPAAAERRPAPDPEPHHVLGPARRRRSGYHRIQWSSNRADSRSARAAGVPGRAGEGPEPAVRDRRRDYTEALAIARRRGRGRRARHPAAGERRRADLRLHAAGPPAGRHDGAGRGRRSARTRAGRRRSRSATTTGRCTTSRSSPSHTYVADGVLVHNSHLQLPRSRHPQHPRVRGGVPRRHGDRAGAELPVDPDDPRRGQRGHRQQHRPQAEGAVDRRRATATRSSATTPTTRPTRPSGWPTRSPACTTRATAAGATSPSSTGPTPRAGSWRSTSCAAASRTRSSAAPASTTGGRSRTRSPTCGRS